MLLTKSNYLLGLQCPKLLWVAKNDKQRMPEPDNSAKHNFMMGDIIGVLATKAFPGGIDLADLGFMENISKTKKAIKDRETIYEAGIMVNNLFSRADVLLPVGENEWDIIEVKSATKVKDINIHDVSFQKYTYEKAGLKIRKCFLMHINNEYIKDGEIEPGELFVQTDITEKVDEYTEGIEERIENMFKIIRAKKEKDTPIGIQCSEPYKCALKGECWKNVPEGSVFEFYYMLKNKCFELYNEGIIRLKDVPEDVKLNSNQQVQRRLAFDGGKHVDKLQIKNFLRNLKYPIYYLDFETIAPAIPKFNGMKPYQRIPFQFSLHTQSKTGKIKHISFLADGTSDPRPKFMQALRDNLKKRGSILVYNQGFEKGIMNESAVALPEFKGWYKDNIEPRVKDLLDVFRDFSYYDPKQKGSASIKAVLPVMSDLKYSDLEISEGMFASNEYERVTYGDVENSERLRVREDLEKYCELDTLAEVEIIKRLKEIITNS
ncbi:DUF2779 domain-containing protein [archaeon]|jgi:hypothetical protein|nr:DUF2779 domain-containing protein [archaeon]MBT7128512.1 DUF2779 domain-containing protein [archaeon]